MEITFQLEGLPALAKRLDTIAEAVAGPIAKEALEAGGEIIRVQAEANVHRLTGALAADIVVVTRVMQQHTESYVLIGPGWNPENFRRSVRRRGKYANEAPAADQSTNPGVYGKFLETGHRAAGKGLAHNLEYKRAAYAARKQHLKVNTLEFGTLSTPPYPWLGPAAQDRAADAFQVIAEKINDGLQKFAI